MALLRGARCDDGRQVKTVKAIGPLTVIVAVTAVTTWFMLDRDVALGAWLLAGLLFAHGWVHLMFVFPRPQPVAVGAGGPDWPFDLRRSWLIATAGLDPGAVRAFGKALMVEPRILLLDEPTAGLAPKFRHEIFQTIQGLNEAGTPILMVEQNARLALSIADRGYVLVDGSNRIEDSGPGLLANREVAQMFLGGGWADG